MTTSVTLSSHVMARCIFSDMKKKQMYESQKMCLCDLPSHTLVLPLHNCRPLYSCVSPLPRDPVEWVCSGECVLFQWHTDWVIYGLLSPRQRLLLGKSRRGATTSLFSPDPMMSGLSAPSLKLGARHPSCWSGSHRDPIGCEPQLDLDRAAVSAVLICIRPEDGNSISNTLLTLLLPWCSTS